MLRYRFSTRQYSTQSPQCQQYSSYPQPPNKTWLHVEVVLKSSIPPYLHHRQRHLVASGGLQRFLSQTVQPCASQIVSFTETNKFISQSTYQWCREKWFWGWKVETPTFHPPWQEKKTLINILYNTVQNREYNTFNRLHWHNYGFDYWVSRKVRLCFLFSSFVDIFSPVFLLLALSCGWVTGWSIGMRCKRKSTFLSRRTSASK